MKLKKLEIENFKCFQKPQEIDFERLTILTGANSSGKSSILYSILGSIQSGEFPLQFSTNGKYVNMGDFKEISHNHNTENEISFGFTFQNGKVQNIKTIWVEDRKNNLPELKTLKVESDYFELSINKSKKYLLNFKYFPEKDPIKGFFEGDELKGFFESFSTLLDKKILPKDTETSDKKKDETKFDDVLATYNKPQDIVNMEFTELEELNNYFLTKGNFRLHQVFQSLTKLFVDYDKKVNYISSFRLHPERSYLEKSKWELKVEKFGEGYLDQIIYWESKNPKKFEELVSIMKKLSLLVDIKTKRSDGGKFEMLVKTKDKGTLASLTDVGFGISQFLPIIVSDLQLPSDSTLFVAQPEIHLHPSVQSSFGGFITDQIKSTQKNYVIETHSEYFLNRIRLAIVKGELEEHDLAVYYLDNNKNDAKIHKITFAKNGQILNAPEDFFKTYMIDVMEIAMNAE